MLFSHSEPKICVQSIPRASDLQTVVVPPAWDLDGVRSSMFDNRRYTCVIDLKEQTRPAANRVQYVCKVGASVLGQFRRSPLPNLSYFKVILPFWQPQHWLEKPPTRGKKPDPSKPFSNQ